jgi:cytochrome P450
VVPIAATQLYAFYYDVLGPGLYIWEIEAMHKQYGRSSFSKLTGRCLIILFVGPIVRIAPNQIHINDPEYIDQVFAGPGKTREKGQMTINGLGTSPTAIATKEHNLHKSRRAALNPFFSKQNIRRLEPTIVQVLDQMLQQLDQSLRTKSPVNVGLLYRATSYDIISEYAFGHGLVSFSRQDLNEPYFQAHRRMVLTWHIISCFPFISVILRTVPLYITTVLLPIFKTFVELIEVGLFILILTRQLSHLQRATASIDKIKSSTTFVEEAQTIFHGLLESTIPESERSPARLAEEAHVLLAAGTDTIANVLTAITYQLLANPHILGKLRAELQDTIREDSLPTFSQIENLPYLSAIIQEGLRLHPGTTQRQERIAPDEDLYYMNHKNHMTYKIPAGTCVSMTTPLLSRLPNLYPSPQEFRPERFLDNPKLKNYQFTFSRGTRNCLGMNLAYQEIYMVLACIFRRYNVWDRAMENKSLTLELFQTSRDDIDIVRDLVTENTKIGSKGVWVVVRGP